MSRRANQIPQCQDGHDKALGEERKTPRPEEINYHLVLSKDRRSSRILLNCGMQEMKSLHTSSPDLVIQVKARSKRRSSGSPDSASPARILTKAVIENRKRSPSLGKTAIPVWVQLRRKNHPIDPPIGVATVTFRAEV